MRAPLPAVLGLLLCAAALRAQTPAAADGTAYLAAYFDKTEDFAKNPDKPESLHYALSRDGFHFAPVNDSRVVLCSHLGDREIRDPMILRDQRGVFHLVATDSWKGRPFKVWDSADLIHWTGERLVTPGDPTLHPTWAPELAYDAPSHQYFAFWTGVQGDWNKTACIRCMTTADFQTWSEPKILFQRLEDGKNEPAMDATIFQAGGKSHLVYRAKNRLRQVTSSGGALGPYDTDDHEILDANVEGPFVYRLGGRDQWNLVVDYFGGNQGKWGVLTSSDGRTWTWVTDPQPPYYQNGAASFPAGVRHGCVLPITAAEAAALTGADWSFVR